MIALGTFSNLWQPIALRLYWKITVSIFYFQTFDNHKYMFDYMILNIIGLVGAFIANLVLYLTTLRASKNLHFNLLDTILHLSIR